MKFIENSLDWTQGDGLQRVARNEQFIGIAFRLIILGCYVKGRGSVVDKVLSFLSK